MPAWGFTSRRHSGDRERGRNREDETTRQIKRAQSLQRCASREHTGGPSNTIDPFLSFMCTFFSLKGGGDTAWKVPKAALSGLFLPLARFGAGPQPRQDRDPMPTRGCPRWPPVPGLPLPSGARGATLQRQREMLQESLEEPFSCDFRFSQSNPNFPKGTPPQATRIWGVHRWQFFFLTKFLFAP